jgi:hypothetical protein
MREGSTEDNCGMNRERDLLPWILGGLSTAAVALAITAVSSQRAVTPAAQAIAIVAPASPPSATPAPAPAPAPMPAPASAPEAIPAVAAASSPPNAVTQAGAQSEARPGQIWACTTKGVKTFSNNPCGENSSLLEVGPINTMNPTMPVHYARADPAQPRYAPPYSDAATQSYADDDPEQEGYENGANSYTIVQGVAVLPRRRPAHHHPHQPPYHHSPAARKL